MLRVDLNDDDRAQVRSLADEVAAKHESVEDEDFLRNMSLYAAELPRSLRASLMSFRQTESASVLVVNALTVDKEAVGPTPAHWTHRSARPPALAEEVAFFLLANLLGDPIGWATQQDGRVMHDVFPIKGHQKEQLGSGSEELLTWHTEDAFHPFRTDYLGLLCLRNPDAVVTTYAAVEDLDLPGDVAAVLREARFPIQPDRSHLPENTGGTRQLDAATVAMLRRSYEWITALDEAPERVAVLFGAEDFPYLRIDPYFMGALDPADDPEAAAALAVAVAEIDRAITGYALRQGEVIFIDNYRAVHGRQPFRARFDGTDRWLKRLNVVRDMRKSRERRLSPASRIIH